MIMTKKMNTLLLVGIEPDPCADEIFKGSTVKHYDYFNLTDEVPDYIHDIFELTQRMVCVTSYHFWFTLIDDYNQAQVDRYFSESVVRLNIIEMDERTISTIKLLRELHEYFRVMCVHDSSIYLEAMRPYIYALALVTIGCQ